MPVYDTQTVIIPVPIQLQLRSQGTLKVYHRAGTTEETAQPVKFSMVCFYSLRKYAIIQ